MDIPNITLEDIERELDRRRKNKYFSMFPDSGPYRRELYVPHMEFIEATKTHSECAFLAGNRTGKSETVTYCATAWLTGLYPDWWTGRVFNRRVDILIAGENAKLVRDSIQMKLIGPPNDMGTGMIPFESIYEKKSKSGVPDALDTVTIRHKDGGFSRLVFGSYDQGREAFQATEYDVVIFDEEPPIAIYTEGLMRTMTRNGLVLIAATPLKGMTELMLEFQKAREDRE